ncbi:galactofuranose ABC transporter, permease protein YjfF [Actinoplanes derwentensis]|uniref:Monosaccharide ABC transporter membrane protein, CUT2 family n=1 Tax=Actinoplanes derwentensis TaxID=113562 RepID=A0A1H1PGK6_9ACTN|nr:galactofuranose ABC transporter, permease protein YjfF [Actinoplanes derwentensis]GID84934.1 sugar ABC transporter permease [Actinoplanes derwentensis]SDS10155.1 monosaccharide ABC transporter membrane protein, CUT2 family [Actinoplanes derwentensis]
MTTVDMTPATKGPEINKRRRVYKPNTKYIPILATLFLLVVMYSTSVANYENFGDPSVIVNLFRDNAVLLVVAVGMTFVIITGGIDLSVGAVISLTTTLTATLLQGGWPPLVVLPAVLLLGALIGAGQGAVIHFFKVEPFIATLAGLFLARGLALFINQKSIPIRDDLWRSISDYRIVLADGVVTKPIAIVALVTVLIAAVVLAWTRFGRNVYAIGGNADSALLMGLPVGRTKIAVYTVSGFCAALGGVLFSINSTSGWALQGNGMELDAIAACVIGGVLLTGGSGYVWGTVLGVLVAGLIRTILNFQGDLNSAWSRIIIGVLLFGFIVMQRLVTRKAK